MAIDKETRAESYVTGCGPRLSFYSLSDDFAANRGQWVRLDTNGKLERADAASHVLGILAASCVSTTTDVSEGTPVYVAWPDIVFEAQVWHSTAASAITARNQKGKSYAIKLDAATNIDAVDIETAAAATDQCVINDWSRKETLGDTNGRVRFTVNPANFQLAKRIAH